MSLRRAALSLRLGRAYALLVLFGGAVPIIAADRPGVSVFLLAGQSNLSGRGAAAELPDQFQVPPPSIRIDYVCSFGGPANTDVHQSNGWAKLLPARKHENTPGEHFGPEIGFGHALAAVQPPNAPIILIKHGRGATSLAEDWNPDATQGPRLYSAFIAQARRALSRVEAEGARPDLRAFAWSQGEADSTRADWAHAYANNLRKFIARARHDLNSPQLLFIIVLTGIGASNPRMTDAATVRAAQREVATRGERILLVDADDLTLLDSVHFDTQGQLQLGEKIARAFLRVEEAR